MHMRGDLRVFSQRKQLELGRRGAHGKTVQGGMGRDSPKEVSLVGHPASKGGVGTSWCTGPRRGAEQGPETR